MKVFYDTNDNNQVVAVYVHDSASAVWNSYSSVQVTDEALQTQILSLATCCRLTIVDGEVTSVTEFHPQAILRSTLRSRVSLEYDQWVEAGIATPVSWDVDDLVILPRDVELLTGVLSIGASQLARNIIVDTDVILGAYKFGDGKVKSAITEKDLEELNASYQSIRAFRFMAHLNVKGGIDAGLMPAVADYEECGLVLLDFDGLGLV